MANPIHSLFLYSFIAFILFATCNCLEDDQCACTPCHANQTCSVGCPVSADCQPNCKNQNPICFTPICLPKNKTAYCHCEKNYVLGPKGNCILAKDCPKKTCHCAKNQTCTIGCPAPPACQPHCDRNLNNICGVLPVCLPENEQSFCHCADGYVLGPKGNCIRQSDCPRANCKHMHCDKNETCSVGCSPPPACRPHCGGRNIFCRPAVCISELEGPYCHCADGYVLGPKGKCIRQSDCPRPKCIAHKEGCIVPFRTNCCPPFTCHITGIDAGYCELPNKTTEKPCIAHNKLCGVPRNRNCCPPYTCHITSIDAGYCALPNKTTEKPCIAPHEPCIVPFRKNCCHPYTCHITGKDTGYCALPKITTTKKPYH